jgi:GT2 family glycosyltransferase
MTTAIIVGRSRPDLAKRCLDSLGEAQPERTVFVVNKCPETVALVAGYAWVEVINHPRNDGFWHGMNLALASVPEREPFCYFGQDVIFDAAWLEHSSAMFRDKFPTGLGLLCFWDGLHDGGIAAHGMTTRAWLNVVYGLPLFPSEAFYHFHLDSEFSHRSKTMARYEYCPASKVPHLHEPSGFKDVDRLGINDYNSNNTRWGEWGATGYNFAMDRLRRTA